MASLPAAPKGVLEPFASLFRRPVWRRAQVLLLGALLSPGRRTVTQALRVVGLGGERHFPSESQHLLSPQQSDRAKPLYSLHLLRILRHR